VSLILAGLVVAGTSGALLVGRWMARRRGDAPERGATGGSETANGNESGDDRRKAPAGGPDESRGNAEVGDGGPTGFVCQLGDVLIRITGEEAWLAGGVVLTEEVPVAVLFVAPEAGHDRAIYVRAQPMRSLLWLEPLDPSAILVGGEPPSSVEHRGIRFERARRLPLRPRRIGVGAPELGDAVIVAEYASAGAERLLVLKGNAGVVRAYRGVELEEGSFEVIPSGKSTLQS
jgi:hypothetical protein